ncbi:MAG: serine/threonine protein kinase [Planctomycetota bacterium]|nr:MAG: serine/threonine protein kinase [Planctomycetota bacterium]
MSTNLYFFGNLAVREGLIGPEQLKEALEVQRHLNKVGYHEPLGEICIKLGFLSEEEVQKILDLQNQNPSSPKQLYGRVALQNKLVTEEELQECLDLQKKGDTYAPIGHYLIQKGYLSQWNHQAILRAIQRITKTSDLQEDTVSYEDYEEEKKSFQNEKYAKVAIERGHVTSDQLEEALQNTSQRPIWEYLLSKKYITIKDHYYILDILANLHRSAIEKESQIGKRRKRDYTPRGMGKKESLLQLKLILDGKKRRKPSWELHNVSNYEDCKINEKETFAHYRLLERLGYGGMAVVYRAQNLESGEFEALKILPPQQVAEAIFDSDMAYDQKRQERFQREINILKQMNHPNIVRLKEVGHYRSYHYFSMELIEGCTLADLLEKAGFLDERWALEITLNICRALAYIWEKKVVHRDIKPENIMISLGGEVKLFDFGLAKSLQFLPLRGDLTSHDVILGTPTYMAPEQTGLLKGQSIDVRTDLYSLGATLFDMLTGAPPFFDDSPLKTMVMHFRDPVPDIREKNKKITEGTARLIAKMMAKKPDERFSHPFEVMDRINHILSGLSSQSY